MAFPLSLIEDQLNFLTDAHRDLIKRLEGRGLNLMEEIPFPPYQVDVYLPDFHAAVEVDGPQHEASRDMRRDDDLWCVYSLPVFRIGAGEVNKPWLWLPHLLLFLFKNRESRDDRWESCKDKTPWL